MLTLFQRTLSETLYAILVLATICATGLSCAALLSQAVRTSPHRSWTRNFNALVIGASYVVVLVASLFLCVKRRVAVRQRLTHISKVHRTIGKADLPKSVHEYISQEYTRACLVAYESLPKDAFHKGWGRPGTQYAGIRFRRALLDTIKEIDTLARTVIPSHPPLQPHTRMLHHFRFILPLLPRVPDSFIEDGEEKSTQEEGEKTLSYLHYYDSAIQIARNSSCEPTEREFEIGMLAAREIIKSLYECQLEMMEDSTAS